MLAEIGLALVLYGVLAVLGAALAGPTRAAVAVRGRIAPVLNHHPGVAWAAAGLAFLLLVLWGGTHALRTWWGILVLGALLAAGFTCSAGRRCARPRSRRAFSPAPDN